MTVDEVYPVQWTGRQAIVVLPEHIDLSNSAAIRGELLSVINRGATALIADLSATASCDHSGADGIARAYQRAVSSGTDLRLVVPSPAVRRMLSINGVDRLVSVYPSRDAALAAREPTAARALVTAAAAAGPGGAAAGDRPHGAGAAAADPGAEVALLDRHGVIVSVNDAWRSFAAANGGEPARTGVGVSYLEVCAAAGDDPVTADVAAAIRHALAGDLPAPLTVEVPCHSPDMARWFEVLISARRHDGGRPLGATVTLSLSRAQRLSSPAAGRPAAAGSADLMTPRLFAAGLALERALGLLGGHPAASSVREAASHLELAIAETRDSAFGRRPAAGSGGRPG